MENDKIPHARRVRVQWLPALFILNPWFEILWGPLYRDSKHRFGISERDYEGQSYSSFYSAV